MESKTLILLCLVALAILEVAGKKKGKTKNKAVDEHLARQALDQLTFSREEQIYNIAMEVASDSTRQRATANDVTNVCSFYKCSEGKVCIVSESNDPSCICAESCIPAEDEESFVCSTQNVTYDSKCDFYRRKCIEEIPESEDLHYFGECRALPPCALSELQEFPHRLREWFSDVMISLSNLDEHLGGLSADDKLLLMNSRQAERHRYAVPVQWKFRSLDRHPHDNFLSQGELMPLRAALIPSEHCASVFFDMCDSNRDLLLDLHEWSTCMGLFPDATVEDK
ncbi:SPARC-like isoform X2 [Apostichopus japonicus]|uniref:SPARC-like isoform X2 n=1 Tax=Stichopus japonicus TaxID=307972 RepID=UPI003AB2B658